MRWLVVAAVCLACKGKQVPPKRDDARVAPADAQVADAALDAATTDAAVRPMTIRSDGVGPIKRKWIEPDDYKAAFPELTIKSEHREGEDFMYDEILALAGKAPVLRVVINERSLFKIEVTDPMFATESGVSVGMTAQDLAAKIKDTKCVFETYDPEADAERVDRSLRCESASLPRVLFELDYAGFKGPEGDVSLKTIAKRPIMRIVWLAGTE